MYICINKKNVILKTIFYDAEIKNVFHTKIKTKIYHFKFHKWICQLNISLKINVCFHVIESSINTFSFNASIEWFLKMFTLFLEYPRKNALKNNLTNNY